MQNLEPFVLYNVSIASLKLTLKSGKEYEFPEALANGRANYILFEELIRAITGLRKTTQSDHTGAKGERYEQKAYFDQHKYASISYDEFQTSASSTFGANNFGPTIKRHLENSEYQKALEICHQTGYDKNDYYIYTNTRGYSLDIPLRYLVVPKPTVVSILNKRDPRLISRSRVLDLVTEHLSIN
jgi:hypothetical protein